MLDQIPTGVTSHSKAPTDGVSSSDMLGRFLEWPERGVHGVKKRALPLR